MCGFWNYLYKGKSINYIAQLSKIRMRRNLLTWYFSVQKLEDTDSAPSYIIASLRGGELIATVLRVNKYK